MLGAVRLQALSQRIETLAARNKKTAVASLLGDWESSYAAARRDLAVAVNEISQCP